MGYDKSDDASVYKISDDTAVINTTDFFPPIVDDPYLFGQIAAANAISDVYAMGGVPRLALNIMTVPKQLEMDTVREILRGGYDKAMEAGVIITGGHTINSEEPIYGLAVTGFVHPDKVLSNSAARPGDALILTKRLGTGIITTAAKADAEMVDSEVLESVYAQMATLNKYAAEVMADFDVHSCTDITGFGLVGHACEMAMGSATSIHIQTGGLNYYEDALGFADMGLIPAGAYNNRDYTKGKVLNESGIPLALEDVLYDPQTSGGLLIALPMDQAEECLRRMAAAGVTACKAGYVTAGDDYEIYIEK